MSQIETSREEVTRLIARFQRFHRSNDAYLMVDTVRALMRERDGWQGIADGKDVIIAQERARAETEPAAGEVKLSARQRAVLIDMLELGAGDNYAIFFRGLTMNDAEIPEIRRVVRALARKGLTHFLTGLMNEDGFVAGSGYGLTKLGVAVARYHRALDRAAKSGTENGCGNG